jgi:dATP pyrophosphohydrolase
MRLPIQVEAIIYRRNGDEVEYLLLKRTPERSGFWQPVTGGVEEGETRKEALCREISEETGLKNMIRVSKGLDYFEFFRPKSKSRIRLRRRSFSFGRDNAGRKRTQ